MKIDITVSGKVQGVGFRYHTKRTADLLGITGWVKNLSNGDVDIEAHGREEQLNKFKRWCKSGPPMAEVSEINIKEVESSGLPPRKFIIKR